MAQTQPVQVATIFYTLPRGSMPTTPGFLS